MLIQVGESLAYVKAQLGHSSISITVDTYGQLIPGTTKAAVEHQEVCLPMVTRRYACPWISGTRSSPAIWDLTASAANHWHPACESWLLVDRDAVGPAEMCIGEAAMLAMDHVLLDDRGSEDDGPELPSGAPEAALVVRYQHSMHLSNTRRAFRDGPSCPTF